MRNCCWSFRRIIARFGTSESTKNNCIRSLLPTHSAVSRFRTLSILITPGSKGGCSLPPMPRLPGHPRHEPMIQQLREIFDRLQTNDRIAFEYDTEMYLGRVCEFSASASSRRGGQNETRYGKQHSRLGQCVGNIPPPAFSSTQHVQRIIVSVHFPVVIEITGLPGGAGREDIAERSDEFTMPSSICVADPGIFHQDVRWQNALAIKTRQSRTNAKCHRSMRA